MTLRWDPKEYLSLARYAAFWLVVVIPLSLAVGSLCALFLWSLDLATKVRWASPSLLWWLPLAGVAIAMVYHLFGKSAEKGNNLIVEEIHEPGGGVPLKMTPLILLSTLATHLFGGSAGREGTAIQMGGSVASSYARGILLDRAEHRILLTAGMAAGFGAVFGTPLAGAVFAMEVLAVGSMDYEALLPCLLASILADRTCAFWGIHHTDYHVGIFAQAAPGYFQLDWLLTLKTAVAGVIFGLTAMLFSELAHGASAAFKKGIPSYWLRPVVGGALLIALTYALGTRDYLGIGVTGQVPGSVSIVSSFQPGGATPWSWLWKTLSTTLTLGSGFKGGEVTPLFFVGSTLGNALAGLLHAPTDLLAGLGFVAVFAGASNTPLACTLMGIELFGGGQGVYIALACFMAYLFSGHSGIYLSQRIGRSKGGLEGPSHGLTLRGTREAKQPPAWFATAPPRPAAAGAPAHRLTSRQLGQLSIHLHSRERVADAGRAGGTRLAHQAIIDAARQAGLPSAMAHPAHGEHVARRPGAAGGTLALNLRVDITGPEDRLAAFCRAHRDLLGGRPMFFKHAEAWDLQARALKGADLAGGA